jgi:hypothetical protein
MLIITAYFPDLDGEYYDGSQEIILTTDDGIQHSPLITSSIGDDAGVPSPPTLRVVRGHR